MADDKELRPIAVGLEQPTEPNYDGMKLEEVLVAIGKAWEVKDMKLMARLSKLHGKKEGEQEKANREKLLAALVETTGATLKAFTELANKLIESKQLDGAEGVWFAYDLGEVKQQGVNPSLRLVQKKARAEGTGNSGGQSSYIASPEKSSDLLAKVGSNVMFAEDTLVTIDKVEQTIAAGTTFQQAYDFSTNGGWRNRCRMALLKEAGVIGSNK